MTADILLTEDLSSPFIDRLAERFRVIREPRLWEDKAALASALASARCVMIRNQTKLPRAALENAPSLRAIGRVGVGLDNIDLQAADELGIAVIAPLEANAVSVAELAIGLIIALARKIPLGDRSTKAGAWDRLGCTGIELHGKTLAICGFGRIGKMAAARARAFGMKIVVFDPFVDAHAPELAQSGATLARSFLEALATADFVSAHLPLTQETARIFDAQAFSSMKTGSFFINTSRGGIMDEAALLQALRSGKVAGAALDVRQIEPPQGENAFATLDNVILTPHIGAFTREAQARTFEAVCSDLERVLHGQRPLNQVNRPKAR